MVYYSARSDAKKAARSRLNKGKKGEDEMCIWLNSKFDLPYTLHPNKKQTTFFGGDILLELKAQNLVLGFEVKRWEAEADSIYRTWWAQCSIACRKYQDREGVKTIPIVCFRRNNRKWNFLISATNAGFEKGWIHISEKKGEEFIGRYV